MLANDRLQQWRKKQQQMQFGSKILPKISEFRPSIFARFCCMLHAPFANSFWPIGRITAAVQPRQILYNETSRHTRGVAPGLVPTVPPSRRVARTSGRCTRPKPLPKSRGPRLEATPPSRASREATPYPSCLPYPPATTFPPVNHLYQSLQPTLLRQPPYRYCILLGTD